MTTCSKNTTPQRWPVVLPTVDVEAAHGSRPFEQMILGETDSGEHWGVFKIAETLERFGATGTFFVDVYEDVFWGEKRMKELCQQLDDRGHDVQLHTHPSWRYDPRDSDELNAFKAARTRFPSTKDFMAKLSVSEQASILSEGKEMLENWIGKPVTIHRSGGYSINDDTVSALKDNDIFIDSSMNRAHANSKLTFASNLATMDKNFIELPVSYYELKLFPGAPGYLRKNLNTNVDTTPIDILKNLTLKFERQDLRTFQLFMHSFTLLDMAPDFGKIGVHNRRHRTLVEYLKFAKRAGFKICSIKELTKISDWQNQVIKGEDFVPTVVAPALYFDLVRLKLQRQYLPKLLEKFGLGR